MSSQGEGVGSSAGPLVTRALTPFLRAPASWPNHSAKAPAPTTITLEGGFEYMNLEDIKYADNSSNFKNTRILSRYFKPRLQLVWYHGGKINYVEKLKNMPKEQKWKGGEWGWAGGWTEDEKRVVALLKYAFAHICKVNANSLNSDTVILKRSNCGK